MNKPARMRTLIIATFSVLVGCSEEKSDTAKVSIIPQPKQTKVIHDVEYYLSHDKEREAMFKRCENNPYLYDEDPNCLSMDSARRKISIQRTVDTISGNTN